MTPSCEAQTCGYRICCYYCDAKEDCDEVCWPIEIEPSECSAFTDDDEE